jgi:hypothetical protein
MLVKAGTGTEEVAKLIMGPAKAASRSGAFKAAHRPISAFDATVILLNPIVQVGAGPMPNASTQFSADRARIAVVAVGGHPVRRHARHRFGRAEKCSGCGHVAVLAEHHVDQSTRAVDGAVEVAPVSSHLDVGLIDIPASADLPRRRRRRSSARAGIDLLSHARTASRLNTMPRMVNISGRSRSVSL